MDTSPAGTSASSWRLADLIQRPWVDRRLAYKNLRTGLIAGALAIVVFAMAWVVGLVY
jgi:hypothetical protein